MSESSVNSDTYGVITDREPKVAKRVGRTVVDRVIQEHYEKYKERLRTITQTSEVTKVPVPTLRSWYNSPTSVINAPSKQIQFGNRVIYLYTEADIEEINEYITNKEN